MFPSAESSNVFYFPQNPDRAYMPFWEQALATWELRAAQGVGQPLVRWQDIDISKPRPWFCNKWAFTLMRLEAGLPVDIDGDPVKLAMLGACRRANPPRAPATESEWEALSGKSGDDEENLSDAGSCRSGDDERPTSRSWVPRARTVPPEEGCEALQEELDTQPSTSAGVGDVGMEDASQPAQGDAIVGEQTGTSDSPLFPPSSPRSEGQLEPPEAPGAESSPTSTQDVQALLGRGGGTSATPQSGHRSPTAAPSSPSPDLPVLPPPTQFFLPPPAPGAWRNPPRAPARPFHTREQSRGFTPAPH